MERKTIFSDIDGTHVFDTRLPDEEEQYIHFQDNLKRDGYISADLETLIANIRDRYYFRLVTARNLVSFRYVERFFYYDSVALENGCVVLDKKGKIDQEWYAHVQGVVGPLAKEGVSAHDPNYMLWQLKDYLEGSGFVVEWQERIASLRVRSQANSQLPLGALYQLLRDHYAKRTELFSEITAERQQDAVDFFPKAAGKGNYILFEAERRGLEIQTTGNLIRIKGTVGMGNDPNDLSMLSLVEFPMTLASAHEDVIAYVMHRDAGVFARGELYHGSRQMLRFLLHNPLIH